VALVAAAGFGGRRPAKTGSSVSEVARPEAVAQTNNRKHASCLTGKVGPATWTVLRRPQGHDE
jgi:hypothetical protein